MTEWCDAASVKARTRADFGTSCRLQRRWVAYLDQTVVLLRWSHALIDGIAAQDGEREMGLHTCWDLLFAGAD